MTMNPNAPSFDTAMRGYDRTAVDANDEQALTHEFEYYDPIYLLPESGQDWWRHKAAELAARDAVNPQLITAGQ